MSTREATDTIRGYFYQFDYSIMKLLELKDEEDKITLEGIEDVDVKQVEDEVAIQCKYYAKTEYNHSVIGKPIRLMLSHFSRSDKPELRYYLYGHFKSGHHKLKFPIDVAFLKKHFLTYTQNGEKKRIHEELELNDQELSQFIHQLCININANDYTSQINQIVDLLQDRFKCSEFEAEHFFYNNAIRLIKDISTKPSIADRTISKRDFLDAINQRDSLFNEWFVIYKGRKKFFKNIKDQYLPSELNTSPFERFFLIDIQKHKYDRSQIKEIIFLISRKWGNTNLSLKRNLNMYCPYIYLNNIPKSELVDLKQELYSEGHKFSDGYDFNGAVFSPHSISITPDKSNGIRVKIVNEIEHLSLCLETINKTKEIYQFYFDSPFFESKNFRVKHIQIPIQDIQDVKEVI